MKRISQKFPFMRESFNLAPDAETLGATVPQEMPQSAREAVYQQIGHTAAYLHAEFGQEAFVVPTSLVNERSHLSFYSEDENAVVTVLAEHTAAQRLGDISIIFSDLGDRPGQGTQKQHEYAQIAGRGPVRRLDTDRAELVHPLTQDQILDRAVDVTYGEAQDMHRFMIEKTDHGLYVPIPAMDALALQRGPIQFPPYS
jgi:hypothetical protein